jgi:hypothetical protein
MASNGNTNGSSLAHERSALLNSSDDEGPKLIDNEVNIGNGYGTINGDGKGSKARLDGGAEAEDEEIGEVEDGNGEGESNPLFEGNKEVKQRMRLLFPAVALGVSSPLSFVF